MLIRTKITLKVNKSEPNIPCSHESLSLGKSSKIKRNLKNHLNFEFYAGRVF